MFKKVLSISLVAILASSTAVFAASAMNQFKTDVKAASNRLVTTTKNDTKQAIDTKTQKQIEKINKKIAKKQAKIKEVKTDASLTAQEKNKKILKLNQEIKELRADIITIKKEALTK